MPFQLFTHEVVGEVQSYLHLRLGENDYTTTLRIAEDVSRPYLCTLYGPFVDRDAGLPSELRIFVVHRYLEGTHSLDLLVQDTDDDAFLNSHAEGTEKYHNRRAQWREGSTA